MKANDQTIQLVEKVWDYCLLGHRLKKADIIFVLGSHDTRVAERAAELFHEGWAPLIVFSGGFGQRPSPAAWEQSEAEVFAKVAMDLGVPATAILREERARNTGENVQFTKTLLAEKEIPVKTVIAVQKPYMERRTYATIKKQWPEIDVVVTSQQVSFKDYIRPEQPEERTINIVVGDLQRLKIYAEKGFSIPQEIPDDVWAAFMKLVKLGYDKQLAKD